MLLLLAELFHADGRTGGHDEANSRFFFLAILRTLLKMATLNKIQEWTQAISLNMTYQMFCNNFQYVLCLTIQNGKAQ